MDPDLQLFFECSWRRLVFLEGKLRKLESGKFRPSAHLAVPLVEFRGLRGAWALPQVATRRGLAQQFVEGFERRFGVPAKYQVVSCGSGIVRTSLDFCNALRTMGASLCVQDIRWLSGIDQRELVDVFRESNLRLEEELDSGQGRLFDEDVCMGPETLQVVLDGRRYNWDIGTVFEDVSQENIEAVLRENVEAHFGVPLECQKLCDANGPLLLPVDFAQLLDQDVPLLYVWDTRSRGWGLDDAASSSAGRSERTDDSRSVLERASALRLTLEQGLTQRTSLSAVLQSALDEPRLPAAVPRARPPASPGSGSEGPAAESPTLKALMAMGDALREEIGGRGPELLSAPMPRCSSEAAFGHGQPTLPRAAPRLRVPPALRAELSAFPGRLFCSGDLPSRAPPLEPAAAAEQP